MKKLILIGLLLGGSPMLCTADEVKKSEISESTKNTTEEEKISELKKEIKALERKNAVSQKRVQKYDSFFQGLVGLIKTFNG